MDKIVLKAQNRDELDKMIKRSITLNDNESINIKVLKEPKKILFFNIKGIYEIDILKNDNQSRERVKKTNFEKQNKNKNFENKKENNKFNKKNENVKDENIKNNFSERTSKKEKVEIINKKSNQKEIKQPETNKTEDQNYYKIRAFMKEFIVNSKLDLTIVKIEKISDRYVVNVDGKDIRYLIGEKGSTLNSVEYLLSSVKEFKNIKVVIDSNNYKEKREESLRDLARKKGKKVLETGRNIKLNPMSARERKIIHEEISYINGLKTESIGEDPKRYLVIKRTKE
ncbi:MAG: single-stranded DNA-binding protein [Leptotrichiaceae bacterium]|nr:single-stranded DNA-binding protein [Leptotrichiaceae bacterium]MBP7100885.1 single-stranded DNA-binding protein [Leptotrichiaceae bacterium]MBP7725537.1 single-stranded DNA-binding protein [Leptotrichiaceae bacterium]MBP9630124.1 single-stranded DNA-binding protein [Leptotrichiaceae bacterium]